MTELRSIVLVEDDADIAVLAVLALGEIGDFEVRHYGSGPELLANLPEKLPDLFLLDYRLPGMSGEELLRELRRRAGTAEVPAIFMTASLMPDRIQALRASGALDVLPKPFDPFTLADEVRKRWMAARN